MKMNPFFLQIVEEAYSFIENQLKTMKRKLHLKAILLGVLFLGTSINMNAQTTVQAVSGLSTTACLGTNTLFLVALTPESLDSPPLLVDNEPLDNINGFASCLGCGTGTAIIFVSIQVTNGTIGSTVTFSLTLEDAGGFTIPMGVTPPNGGTTPSTVTYIFSINVDGPPSVDIVPTDPLICNGNPTNLSAIITNGASASSYIWNADGGNSSFQGGVPSTSASAVVVAEDTYHVTVSNFCGMGTESTTVGADVTPVVDLSCEDNGNNTTTISAEILNNASDVTIRLFSDGNLEFTYPGLDGPTTQSQLINSVDFLNEEFTVTATNGCGSSSNSQSCEILLPVELQHFSAFPEEESVLIEWSTITEINNDFFTIEKSYNGIDFMDLATIQGAGTTQETQSYNYLDENAMKTAVATNTLYYRLKQTDFDGTTTYSNLVTVAVPQSNLFSIQRLWQESNQLIVSFAIPSKSEVEGRIYSLDGRLINIQMQEVEAGNVQLQFNTDDLAAGMYLFSASNGNTIISEKFIKL